MFSIKRFYSLARAEWLQFWRNKTIVIMAVLFPVGMPIATWFLTDPQSSDEQRISGGMGIEIYMFMGLFMVLFYSVLSMTTTRRDEGVLKRLRTGESRDAEILAAIAAPGTGLVIAFLCLIAGFFATVGSIPVNPILVVLALLLGILVFTGLAYLTSSSTKNAESAQMTSMPVMALAILSLSEVRSLFPENGQELLSKLPISPIYDLAVLGWTGAPQENFRNGEPPMGFTETFEAAVQPVIVTLIWIAVLLWSVYMYMRWDTHRG